MAKMKVHGDAVVVTSSLKLEDIARLEKFRAKALTLADKETKEPLFRVAIGFQPSLNANGVVYSSHNSAGFAIATLPLPSNMNETDKKAYISDTYGPAIVLLNQAEKAILASNTALSKEFDEANAAIEFID